MNRAHTWLVTLALGVCGLAAHAAVVSAPIAGRTLRVRAAAGGRT